MLRTQSFARFTLLRGPVGTEHPIPIPRGLVQLGFLNLGAEV